MAKLLMRSLLAGAVEAVEFVVVRDSPIVPGSLSEALFLVCAVRGSSTLFYINSV